MISLLWYLQARLFPKYGMVGMSTGIVALASYHLAHNRYLVPTKHPNRCPEIELFVADPYSTIRHPLYPIPAHFRIIPLNYRYFLSKKEHKENNDLGNI